MAWDNPMGTRGFEFFARRVQIIFERPVGVQPRDCIGADVSTLHRVATPMHVAHHAARSVSPAARENGIGLIRRDLREHQRPCHADGAVSRRI